MKTDLMEIAEGIAVVIVIVGAVVLFFGVGSGLIDPYKVFDSEPRRHPIMATERSK